MTKLNFRKEFTSKFILTADILLLLLVSRPIQVFDYYVILVSSVTLIFQLNLQENVKVIQFKKGNRKIFNINSNANQ